MGATQVITCDCCEEVLASTSVLDAVIVTALLPSGEVQQSYYGVHCGCGKATLDAVTAAAHEEHVTTDAAPAEVVAPTLPITEPAPEPVTFTADSEPASDKA